MRPSFADSVWDGGSAAGCLVCMFGIEATGLSCKKLAAIQSGMAFIVLGFLLGLNALVRTALRLGGVCHPNAAADFLMGEPDDGVMVLELERYDVVPCRATV
ncbi:hypothetical protein Nepgr_022909 [Nepenthes gracilis]|uniref:Uncharacterized protein n=1 Tax=Nepenthes gracilis TaxID=150966 RepID=A0AAD3T1Q8_NEPGR|nr:hypothetical protein Nepgr_022909 [Nepenthes gracilis]